jgi:hypothetical protein
VKISSSAIDSRDFCILTARPPPSGHSLSGGRVNEPGSPAPIRLTRSDRLALAYRLGCTILGAALVAGSYAWYSWENPTIALFVGVTVGGAIAYHVLTSVARCPRCNARMINLAVTSPETRRKLFRCSHCGTVAYLTAGFFWQDDVSG